MPDQDPLHAAEQTATDPELTPVTDPERSELPPLRHYNAFAAFSDHGAARDALLALERQGIDGHDISALALTRGTPAGDDQDAARRAANEEDAAMVKEVGAEGLKGGTIGAALGALGGAAVTVAIPGVGVAIGAGILAAAAGGAVAGAGVGGFAGALSQTPASRSWERALVEVGDGEIVVGVHTDDRETYDLGLGVLRDAGARNVRSVDEDGEVI